MVLTTTRVFVAAAAGLATAAGTTPAHASAAEPVLAQGLPAYFTQSFYHASIIPLLLATIALAYTAKPSTNEAFPEGFRQFRLSYLAAWAFCVAADWLQGPYVYALYASYGFTGSEIAQLFVMGFASSMVFGCIVGSVTDRIGRKRCCIAYCAIYSFSCMTKHFNQYWVLMLGRFTGGVSTSMLYSCFECWLVNEHVRRHKFSEPLLGYMFGMMFTVMYLVAIASGLVGQVVADAFAFGPVSEGSLFYTGGYVVPFDVAILCLVVGGAMIAVGWEENYGSTGGGKCEGFLGNLGDVLRLLVADRNTLLMCIIVASFEGAMFAFVFNWTPALASTTTPPPHGVIFALFMMACTCGASASSLLGGAVRPAIRLAGAFAAGLLSFAVASWASADPGSHLGLTFAAFLVFEFCVGVYWPCVGVLKSEIVPEKVRGTMYNLYRVPLNAIVVALLLSKISITTCFNMNSALLFLALLSVALVGRTVARTEAGDCELAEASEALTREAK